MDYITPKRGGIWVDINFDPSFDRILFRADVDALPIQEATELPYRSKIPGVMHSCGHDMHAAMLLSAFKAIATAKDAQWKNNLRFLFQRAEEFGRVSGAEKLVKTTKLLEGVNRAYAIHVSNTKPAGQFASCPGPILGSTDSFTVKIQSTGGFY
jgi:amidohydrolase